MNRTRSDLRVVSRSGLLTCLAIGFPLVLAARSEAYPAIFARLDLDGDGRVDQADLVLFTACRAGPSVPTANTLNCRLADSNRDGDVDQDDFGAWQRCFNGSQAANPDCAGLLNRFDFDGNSRVDDADLAVFVSCSSGPGVPAPQSRACRLADAEGDGDVDNDDLGLLQLCYNPGAPADPFCPGPIPPHGTVTLASGTEDTDLVISLAGFDPYRPNSVLPVTIASLPTAGSLFQLNGTPITSTPVNVIDATGKVMFRPSPNGNGSPYASFTYTVFSDFSGQSSNPTSVSVAITPVNDPPLAFMASPQTYEDTPFVFQLGAIDPDLPNDTLTAIINIPPNRGAQMYQVAPDGTPRTDLPPIGINTVVTNPDRKVYMTPPLNFHDTPGFPHVAFRYSIQDTAGAVSDPLDMPVNIISVNDPPVANPFTFSSVNIQHSMAIDLRAWTTDVEVVAGEQTLSTCIDVLPQHGTLYQTRNGDQLSNPITQPDTCVPTLQLYYARSDWAPFGCGPDPSPSIYPLDDSVSLHMYDGVDNSNTVTDTLRVTYYNTPPAFTGPTSVDVLEDSYVTFEPMATDIDGNEVWFAVAAPLPTKGALYFHTDEFGEYPVVAGQFTPEWPTRFTYIPFPNAHTGDGVPDVIHVQMIDIVPPGNPGVPRDCDTQIQLNITPVNDAPAVTATSIGIVDVSGDLPPVVTPATITGVHVTDDALPTDLLKVTLTAQGDYAGNISLISTAGLASFLQVSPTQIQIQGTLTALNTVFAQGIQWFAAPLPATEVSTPHSLVVLVNDQGHSGAESPPVPLTATISIEIEFSYQGTLPFRP